MMNWLKLCFKILMVLALACVFFLLLVLRNDLPKEEVDEKYRTPESHFIEVDGVLVHVRFMGEGDPVVLLHGSFSSLHTWDSWQQELSPYFMTISLDFPGHGLTGPDPDKRYSVLDYGQLVLKLTEKLNLEKFHLAGNSMGGAVALQVASVRPDKVLTLNLIDASGAPAPMPRKLEGARNTGEGKPWIFKMAENPFFAQLLLKCTPKFLFKMNMMDIYSDPSRISSRTVDRYYELMLREGNRRATLDRLAAVKESRIDFDRLTMPTLILWGEHDTWIPLSQAHLFEKVIPRAHLVVLKGAGHVPMEEIPTESVAEYLSFLGVEIRKDYFNTPKYVSYAD